MEPFARALNEHSYTTLNIPYPSARLPIAELASHVKLEVETLSSDQPIHFITHSLGAIILRQILAEEVPWQIGRIIMLAPPNQGSEIVDWISERPILKHLLGPAGRELGSNGLPCTLPQLSPTLETAVIMGNQSKLPFFRRLLDPVNDGIVSSEKGKMNGISGFRIIPTDHTFIQMHPEAIRLSLGFLKSGKLPQ
jgi:triacylglycerol lipase